MLFQLPKTALIWACIQPTPLLGHIALKFSGDGHYQLLVVVLQRHGWNHSLEAVLNEHQHSRREERGRDELVAQCLQSNVPSHAI